jgi:ketosteroid isomerase-like protein
MSEEARNVEMLRTLYARWHDSRGADVASWLECMADTVDWRSLAEGAAGMEFTQRAVGKDDVRGYFELLGRDWEMQSYTVDHFVAQGDRVVMLGRCAWKHRATGKFVDTPKADAITLADGKIVGFMEYYDTAQALAATVG